MTSPKPLPADHAQRELALDPAQSFIVQAPAGSGKTELLVRRYLTLLAYAEHPESIVAITFTRKAASEMQRRILNELRKGESERAQAVLRRDRELGWQILENPSRLRIQTIDSFCFSIARQMPFLSGFGAAPALVDDASGLYLKAARQTLSQLDSGQPWAASIERLLHHLDNNFKTIEGLLVEMLGKRDQWLRLLYRGFDRAELEGAFQDAIGKRLLEVRDSVPDGFEATLPGDDRDAWLALADKYLTKSGDFRANLAKKLNVSREDEDIRRFSAQLDSVRSLPAPHYEEEHWEVLAALADLLKVANAQLRIAFQESGQVDFTEVSQAALRALGTADNPTDLAYSLDYRIQHLLVDEFQDTSFSQYSLLERLTAGWEPGDGRSLFVVGDPMQSVYRFREADVGLFLRARRGGLGDLRLIPITLTVNFRSQRNIVDWVNQSFAGILAEAEDEDTGAVPYSPAIAHNPPLEADAIHVHPYLERQDDSEAERVVELVRAASGEGTAAILVRAKSHAVQIAIKLTEAGIRFRAVDLESLDQRQAILDLISLTRALLNPADRVAWLAVLRAPWRAMTLAELLAVPDNPVEAAPQVLRDAVANRGRVPLRRWVEETWMALGGPACVRTETDFEDADAYFELLEAHSQGAELADLDVFREQVKKLFAKPDVESDESVQILTMHKAKGLQFDTVILPGLGRRARSDPHRLLNWLEIGGKLLLAPIKQTGQENGPIQIYLREIDKQKSQLETARLLYVAATRTKKFLHLLGHVSAKGTPDGTSLLHHLWSAVQQHFAGARLASAETAQERIPIAVRKLAFDWRLPAPPPAVEWGSKHIELTAEAASVTFEWASDTLRHTGTVVHRMMQRIAREGLDAWGVQRIAASRPYFLASLATLGVPAAECNDAADQVQLALSMTLDDPRGRWALSPHEDAQSEYALTGFVDGRLFTGTVDRTFVDSGVRWIVDFKTSAHEGGGLDEFLNNELLRYRKQLERYAALLSAMDERPVRLGLYFPLLGGWREWSATLGYEDQRLAHGEVAASADP
jgi:ATP-dependent helicase/nuclease subunit A